MRGGGGNFGIVTNFEFALHPIGPDLLTGLIVYPLADGKSVMQQYREFAESAPDELSVWAVLRQAPPLPFLPAGMHGKGAVILALLYAGDPADGERLVANLGLVPEFASTLLLPQVAGRARAAEKLLLGRPFPAAEAVVMGIANAVLPTAEVVPHAQKVARMFNALPPGAVRDTKKLLRHATATEVRDAIHREASYFGPRLAGDEAREAIAAILEKRAADFSKFR